MCLHTFRSSLYGANRRLLRLRRIADLCTIPNAFAFQLFQYLLYLPLTQTEKEVANSLQSLINTTTT